MGLWRNLLTRKTPSRGQVDAPLISISEILLPEKRWDELADDERAHAESMTNEKRRAAFIERRGLLREQLMLATGVRPELLRLKRRECPHCGAPHGRPYSPDSSVEFSTSSTDHWAVVAVHDRPVGVDVEALVSEVTLADLLPQLHPNEIREIEGAKDARHAFTRVWTRKEALLKATGEGLAVSLCRDDVTGDVIQLVNGGRVLLGDNKRLEDQGAFISWAVLL